MKIYDVIIIGAGASGLMAAVHSAKENSVLIVEANSKIGKKLLATGNGKCNLSNTYADVSHYYGDDDKIRTIFESYDSRKICEVFADMGIMTFTDSEGRIYPKGGQAATIVKTLADICAEKNVECKLEFEVTDVQKFGDIFSIMSSEGEKLKCKKLILATGGKASPNLSGSLKGYDIAKSLGHTVTKLYPVLTGFLSEEKFLKSLSGVRAKANVQLVKMGKSIASEKGEVIFNNKAVSGICIFNLSIYGAKELESTGKLSLNLEFCEDMSKDDIVKFITNLIRLRPNINTGDVLNGIMNMKLGFEIVKLCKIDTFLPISKLKPSQIESIADKVKNFKINVTGLKGFADAQLTMGGVPLSEIDLNTMMSKKCTNLYLTGELLNIHGDCGGFNLHFAWVTGIIAGNN